MIDTDDLFDRYEVDNQGFESFTDYLIQMMNNYVEEVKKLREQYTELREALVGDSPNWTHEELIEKALELTKPAELEFGEWHTDEGDE